MANIWAITNNSLWSNTGTWLSGIIPSTGDLVWANGRNVICDTNFTVQGITAQASGSLTGSGQFIISGMTSGRCTRFSGFVPGSTALMLHTGTGVVNLHGNCFGPIIAGSNHTIHNSGSGIINTSGDIYGGNIAGRNCVFNRINGKIFSTGLVLGGNTSSLAIANLLNGEIGVSGNVSGSGTNVGAAIHNSGHSGVVKITGNVYAGMSATAYAVANISGGRVEIYGNAYGSSANYIPGSYDMCTIGNFSTGTVYMSGNIYGKKNSSIWVSSNSGAKNILNGNIYSDSTSSPIYANNFSIQSGASPEISFEIISGAQNNIIKLYSTGTGLMQPLPIDVRSGVIYGTSPQTGTLVMPSSNSVAAGVKTDSSTGTANLTENTVASAIGNLI